MIPLNPERSRLQMQWFDSRNGLCNTAQVFTTRKNVIMKLHHKHVFKPNTVKADVMHPPPHTHINWFHFQHTCFVVNRTPREQKYHIMIYFRMDHVLWYYRNHFSFLFEAILHRMEQNTWIKFPTDENMQLYKETYSQRKWCSMKEITQYLFKPILNTVQVKIHFNKN